MFFVAAYNEAANLPGRIANLLTQNYPPEQVEIIVASDGSIDDTPRVLTEAAAASVRVKPLLLPRNQGKAATLNEAVAVARGELIVFADARQTFAPDVLARLAENFADPAVGSASGELILTEGEAGVAAQVGLYWRYEKWIRRSESRAGSMLGATGAIYAIRRALWRPLPPGTLLDDFLVPMRIVIGGPRVRGQSRAIFDERAKAFDRASVRAGQEFRRKVRTLAGNFQAFAHEPSILLPWRNRATWFQVWSHKVFRLMVPYALAGLLVTSLAAPGVFYRFATAGQAIFYAAALAGWLLEWRGRRIPWRPVSLAYTFTTLNAAAAAGLFHWLARRDTKNIWQKAYSDSK